MAIRIQFSYFPSFDSVYNSPSQSIFLCAFRIIALLGALFKDLISMPFRYLGSSKEIHLIAETSDNRVEDSPPPVLENPKQEFSFEDLKRIFYSSEEESVINEALKNPDSFSALLFVITALKSIDSPINTELLSRLENLIGSLVTLEFLKSISLANLINLFIFTDLPILSFLSPKYLCPLMEKDPDKSLILDALQTILKLTSEESSEYAKTSSLIEAMNKFVMQVCLEKDLP